MESPASSFLPFMMNNFGCGGADMVIGGGDCFARNKKEDEKEVNLSARDFSE
ncbi:hypothetical protein A2U01_0020646 [Trifolium medium]|uniref:Uncharacterized protein n=1 Tax=Trifolium medium TaxID=97028 RepID=A0A392NIL9_9FABA|nr:hypothetical protein [Trifolium medium]